MENERNNKPVPAQWLHMLNSSHIQRKLDQGPKLKAIFESGRKPEEIIDELYLTILSRPPTPAEVEIAMEYGRPVTANKPSAVAKPPVAKPSSPSGKGAGSEGGPQAKPVGNLPSSSGRGAGGEGGLQAKPTAPKLDPAKKPAVSAKPVKVYPAKRHDDWVDIAWALINSEEFLYRH